MSTFDDSTHRLILAAEIAGYLHDLGKLHPEFAGEMLTGGRNFADTTRAAYGIKAAHGAILELTDDRPYPTNREIAKNDDLAALLECLRADSQWALALALPEAWVNPGTIQARGLGAPLRQHHVHEKVAPFPRDELAFLGDLYAQAADIRDSALDKGSAGAAGGKQGGNTAEIADAFARHRSPYSRDTLDPEWKAAIALLREILLAPDAATRIVATRHAVLTRLRPIFEHALGETRRPTNDVTLNHHAHSTASFFKAAIAEGALRRSFTQWQEEDSGGFNFKKLGRVRFRLLGVRWDWAALTRGMLSPVALASMYVRRCEVTEALRCLVEEEAAIANVIYEDDDGVLILAPGFFEDKDDFSEKQFADHILDPLAPRFAQIIESLGTGTPFRLCWSTPTLYLTDYVEALGLATDKAHQRHLQAGEEKLRELWALANTAQDALMQICPQCGLRPAKAREYALSESAVGEQALCEECPDPKDAAARRDRTDHLANAFGFSAANFDLGKLAKAGGNSRVALLSVSVDGGAIASGNALVTQLARPLDSIEGRRRGRIETANDLGDWFKALLDDLRLPGKAVDDKRVESARRFIGDDHWLKRSDGAVDGRGNPLDVVEGFFLRESAGLRRGLAAEWGLARHDGDWLALFAMRKHASPARLQRLWDDLRGLWKALAMELAEALGANIIPLTLDARGLRFIVAAPDADAAVKLIGTRLSTAFAKLRGGLAAHVSCVVMRAKFPLYIALDVLGRLDARIPQVPHQTWRVKSKQTTGGIIDITWETETKQGDVDWHVDDGVGTSQGDDKWHPHVIAISHKGKPLSGPERLIHMRDLQPNDKALIPPMTFDYVVLAGSGHRHQIVYDQELRRPHWVMGKAGRSPLLLETFAEFSRLVEDSGWGKDLTKLKGLQGEMVETYEKWVRDDLPGDSSTGRDAWHAHLHNILWRYVIGDDAKARHERLFKSITDGRFFDAVEWITFVSKKNKLPSEENV
ncbi:MAG TPA: hypothetical protein PK752_10265 [Accumulibacter sp.]|nr:hypothetical protein [Accumulibacter sp.]